MQPPNTLKLLVLMLFISCYSVAQTDTLSGREVEFKKLVSEGLKAKNQADYPQALEYFTKAEAFIKKTTPKKVMFLKRNIADTYNLLSNSGEALGYYQQVLKLAEELDSKKDIASILSNIGVLYAFEKDPKALQYFIKAYDVAKDYKLSGDIRSQIAVNISHMYNLSGQYKTAQKYLLEVENLETTKATKQMWKINYAESLMLEGNVMAAEKIVKQLLNDPEINCYVCITELLSKIYLRQDKKDLAILYAKKSLSHTSRFTEKIDLYNHISKIYYQTNNPLAFKYKDSVIAAKDSLAAHINRGLYESNKVKLKVQDYQNQLQTNHQKQEKQQFLFIGVTVLSILLFLLVYRGLKNKIIKQKQEKIIAENEKKIFDLEMYGLKNDIAEKNRRLSTKALYLSGRNELIEEVIDSLSHIPEISQKKEISDSIKTLKNYLKSDSEWDDFISYFEQVNPVFIKTLTEKYPELNSSDIRFICYIYMNLDLREIANIFNITYNAAVKRHRRIKEKMKIDTEVSISEFLMQEFRNQ